MCVHVRVSRHTCWTRRCMVSCYACLGCRTLFHCTSSSWAVPMVHKLVSIVSTNQDVIDRPQISPQQHQIHCMYISHNRSKEESRRTSQSIYRISVYRFQFNQSKWMNFHPEAKRYRRVGRHHLSTRSLSLLSGCTTP